MPGHTGDIDVVPSAQLQSPQQDYPPGRLQESPFCCATPCGQAGGAQGSSLTHTQHSLPPADPRHRELGVAVKAGEQTESKKPLKALLPMAISCLFPTSRDHKCFLSKATLLQRAGRGQCPPLPRGELPGIRDGMADALERPGDSGGHCQAAPAPSPFISKHSRPPPTYADICGHLCSGRCQPLNTSLLSPIQHPTPGTKAQKIPALADVDQPEWSKISSSPACSQGFNSSVRTSVRNCSRSAASPCHVNIQLLLANNSTPVTACGETFQIPTTSAVEKHFPVPELAWDRPCPC